MKPRRALLDAVDEGEPLLGRHRSAVVALDDAGGADDGGERASDVVGDRPKERVLEVVGRPELLGGRSFPLRDLALGDPRFPERGNEGDDDEEHCEPSERVPGEDARSVVRQVREQPHDRCHDGDQRAAPLARVPGRRRDREHVEHAERELSGPVVDQTDQGDDAQREKRHRRGGEPRQRGVGPTERPRSAPGRYDPGEPPAPSVLPCVRRMPREHDSAIGRSEPLLEGRALRPREGRRDRRPIRRRSPNPGKVRADPGR